MLCTAIYSSGAWSPEYPHRNPDGGKHQEEEWKKYYLKKALASNQLFLCSTSIEDPISLLSEPC